MRSIVLCFFALSLVGCHCGPRWNMRDRDSCTSDRCSNHSTTVPSSQPDAGSLSLPPLPVHPDRGADSESAGRSRGFFGNGFASRNSQPANASGRANAPAQRSVAQDETVKQLMADLESVKREKAALQNKLNEESVKQSQQRLELEARMLVLQERLRQQSALQQVAFQQQAAAMSRTTPVYNGPVVSSSVPFSNGSSTPSWNTQATPTWNSSPAPTWNSPSAPPTSSVEVWPYSPQRR